MSKKRDKKAPRPGEAPSQRRRPAERYQPDPRRRPFPRPGGRPEAPGPGQRGHGHQDQDRGPDHPGERVHLLQLAKLRFGPGGDPGGLPPERPVHGGHLLQHPHRLLPGHPGQAHHRQAVPHLRPPRPTCCGGASARASPSRRWCWTTSCCWPRATRSAPTPWWPTGSARSTSP